MKLQQLEVPNTDIRSIEESEHKYEIFSCLCSGWSAHRVHERLRKQHGIIIPVADIAQFAASIPEDSRLTFSVIREILKGIDVRVDLHQEIADQLMLMKTRLEDAVSLEQATGEQDPENRRPKSDSHTLVGQRLRLYWKSLLEVWDRVAEAERDFGKITGSLPPAPTTKKLSDILAETVEGEYHVEPARE